MVDGKEEERAGVTCHARAHTKHHTPPFFPFGCRAKAAGHTLEDGWRGFEAVREKLFFLSHTLLLLHDALFSSRHLFVVRR